MQQEGNNSVPNILLMDIEESEIIECPICEDDIAVVRGINPIEGRCSTCGATLLIPAKDEVLEVAYQEMMYFRVF